MSNKKEQTTVDAYCPECETYICDERVTFEECCDTCGTHIEYHTKDTEVKTNMEKILVPEELALVLKEMGFDEPYPTYEEAFKWFKQKKIKFRITDHLYTSVYHKIIVADKETEDIYDCYEEAKNECLKKLIEIVKEGKNENI
jgi:hypothetical protein